jgi:hypothetical protein
MNNEMGKLREYAPLADFKLVSQLFACWGTEEKKRKSSVRVTGLKRPRIEPFEYEAGVQTSEPRHSIVTNIRYG